MKLIDEIKGYNFVFFSSDKSEGVELLRYKVGKKFDKCITILNKKSPIRKDIYLNDYCCIKF